MTDEFLPSMLCKGSKWCHLLSALYSQFILSYKIILLNISNSLCYRIHGKCQRDSLTIPLTSAWRPLCSYRCHPNTRWLFLRDCSISHTGLIYHTGKQTRVRRGSRISFLKQIKRTNGSPFFVFDKDLVQVTGVMHKHGILNLPQKTCVHFHKILLEYRTWKYEAMTHRFKLKSVLH